MIQTNYVTVGADCVLIEIVERPFSFVPLLAFIVFIV